VGARSAPTSKESTHDEARLVGEAISGERGATGPLFHYSDTWQLVINTGTTVVTFLMVFLIQNTQNREARITQLKLDELIRAVAGARNSLVDMEHMSDEELARLQSEFEALCHVTATHRTKRRHAQRSGAH